jgi:hypothetical protein
MCCEALGIMFTEAALPGSHAFPGIVMAPAKRSRPMGQR